MALYFFNNRSTQNSSPAPTPTPSPTISQDDLQIKEVLQKEVPNKSGVKKFEVVSLKTKDNDAVATTKPLDVETDNAFVILQKKDNNWEVIYGPGTDISLENPIYKALPQGLLGF